MPQNTRLSTKNVTPSSSVRESCVIHNEVFFDVFLAAGLREAAAEVRGALLAWAGRLAAAEAGFLGLEAGFFVAGIRASYRVTEIVLLFSALGAATVTRLLTSLEIL